MLKNTAVSNLSRLAKLHGLDVLDSGTEQVYEEITSLTAEICDAPICLISLVEEDRQWFKSEVGIGLEETKIEQSICARAVEQNDYLEIKDTQTDPRTMENALCQGDKPIRFYAGAILRTLDGWPLGTLCVLDYKARRLSPLQKRVLKVNANSVTRQLELTRALVETVGLDARSRDQVWLSPEEKQFNEQVRARFKSLTPRERQILKLIAGHSKSLSSKEIGRELNISHRTVHHHRAHIMAKMEVESVAELITVSLKAILFR